MMNLHIDGLDRLSVSYASLAQLTEDEIYGARATNEQIYKYVEELPEEDEEEELLEEPEENALDEMPLDVSTLEDEED